MTRASWGFVAIGLAFDATAIDRPSQGSQLKAQPTPARSTQPSSAPLSPPVAPAITTAVIRLVGATTGKEGDKALPSMVATPVLQLWGADAAGAPVNTAALVLLGPVQDAASPIETDPIRLWAQP